MHIITRLLKTVNEIVTTFHGNATWKLLLRRGNEIGNNEITIMNAAWKLDFQCQELNMAIDRSSG